MLLNHNRLDVNLNPGKYLIELRLPGGNLLRREVEVKDQPSQIVFEVGSPHELLWLQAVVGNIGAKSDYDVRLNRVGQIRRFRGVDAAPKAWIVSSKTLSVGEYAISSELLASRLPVARSEVREGYFMAHPELRRCAISDKERGFGPPPLALGPVKTDGVTEIFELDPNRVRSLTFQNQYIDEYYKNDRFVRLYFWTQLPGFPPQYCVLPIPWQNAESGEPAFVQMFINVDPSEKAMPRNYDTLHRIALTVDDQYFSSLIGYLGSGEIPSASVLLRQAEQVLFAKVNNPLAAAAGAYVLLEQTELDEHRRWHDWIRNLTNWYKWLPDGAIQWAWLQMVEENMQASDADIRNSLVEAYNRGLPYYSAGVRLLLNGLTVFSQRLRMQRRSDPEIEKALNNVQLLASRIDRRQPFTCVIAD